MNYMLRILLSFFIREVLVHCWEFGLRMMEISSSSNGLQLQLAKVHTFISGTSAKNRFI
jgi:hypothetical protein